MTIRTRKFVGTIALLVLVVVWSLLGMTVAQTPWLANSGLLQAIFYVVAGLGWVLPAMPIISWMSQPDVVSSGLVRVGCTGAKSDARQHHPHHAQRALPAVPGDARQRVQIGAALGSTTPGSADAALAKPDLLGHRHVLPAKGVAIAERIGEMPDVAVEGGLRHRLAHRHLALGIGVFQARQHRIVHRGAADRHIRIGGELCRDRPSPSMPRATAPRGRPSSACRDR